MIRLTRLSGSQFVLNSDLIEKVDSTPDTLISLVDGKKYIVLESLEDIIDLVTTFRASVIALSGRLSDDESEAPRTTRLTSVPAMSPLGSGNRGRA